MLTQTFILDRFNYNSFSYSLLNWFVRLPDREGSIGHPVSRIGFSRQCRYYILFISIYHSRVTSKYVAK